MNTYPSSEQATAIPRTDPSHLEEICMSTDPQRANRRISGPPRRISRKSA